jgi:antitoxin component YwqK of YwqJK toxin-antitoxin module
MRVRDLTIESKKLILLLFTILIASCAKVVDPEKIDFSSDTFCVYHTYTSPKIDVRDGLFYLLNQQEPYSGENICVYKSNGQYYIQGIIKKGLRYGKQTSWYEDGQKWEEGNYKDGVEDGKWTGWHTNGPKNFEVNFKNGREDGKFTAWDENGQISFKANLEDGKADGKLTSWDENGQISFEANFEDGKPDGKWIGWDENGQKEAEGNWKEGEQDGKWTEWDENSQIESEATFKDGECVSGDCDELTEPESDSYSINDFLRDAFYALIQSQFEF